MSQPPAYTIATDFSVDESSNLTGRSTVRTANLDTELTNISAFVSSMRTNIALIQADDGTIKDDAVDLPTLAPDVITYITTNGNGWFASDTGAVIFEYRRSSIIAHHNRHLCCDLITIGTRGDGEYVAIISAGVGR